MKLKHIVLVGVIAFILPGCDKSSSSNRSSNEAAAVQENPASGDATGVDTGDITTTEGKIDPATASSGQALYGKLCAGCHQTLDKTDIPKTPISKVTNAIAEESAMTGLKDTPEKDLQAIVAALSEVSPGKGKGKEDEATEE